jgi:hypothetical protein
LQLGQLRVVVRYGSCVFQLGHWRLFLR